MLVITPKTIAKILINCQAVARRSCGLWRERIETDSWVLKQNASPHLNVFGYQTQCAKLAAPSFPCRGSFRRIVASSFIHTYRDRHPSDLGQIVAVHERQRAASTTQLSDFVLTEATSGPNPTPQKIAGQSPAARIWAGRPVPTTSPRTTRDGRDRTSHLREALHSRTLLNPQSGRLAYNFNGAAGPMPRQRCSRQPPIATRPRASRGREI
jgi:hypothetical protein